jgi:PleD family two-component response regulator
VLPAFVLDNISEDQCEFEEKNEHFITIRTIKAKRIYHSDSYELAIIVFDESKNIQELIRSLMLSEYNVE